MADQRNVGAKLSAVGVAAALAISLVACTSSQDGADNVAAPLPDLYAYMTTDALVIMSGTSELVRKIGTFAPNGGLAWTADGRHVAVIAIEDDQTVPTDRNLVAVNVESQQARTFRCPACLGVAPVGEGKLVAFTGTGELWRFDLASDDVPVRAQSDLPSMDVGPEAMAGLPDAALLRGAVSMAAAPRGSASQVFLLSPDGAVRQVDDVLENAIVDEAVGTVRNSGDGSAFAVQLRLSGNWCIVYEYIYLLNPQTGAMTKTDTSEIMPHDVEDEVTPGEYASLAVQSMWWAQGELYATFAAWTCTEPETFEDDYELKYVTESSVWRLDNGRWQPAPEKLPGTLIELDGGTTVLIDLDDQGTEEGRPLYAEASGTRTTLTETMLVVSAP